MSDEWPHHKTDNLDVFVEKQEAEILRLRAENEKLRAALAPFARHNPQLTGHDDWEFSYVFSIGEMRAAAAALKDDGK